MKEINREYSYYYKSDTYVHKANVSEEEQGNKKKAPLQIRYLGIDTGLGKVTQSRRITRLFVY